MKNVDFDFSKLQETLVNGRNAQRCLDRFLVAPPGERTLPAGLSFVPGDPANLGFMLATKAVLGERIRQGWYKDNLIILPTMEKSGSTFSEIMLCDLLIRNHKTNARYFPAAGNAGPTSFCGPANFSYLSLLSIPDGGVLRGCFEPTALNVSRMKRLGCPVLVLMRHPADRIIAHICMRYKIVSDNMQKPLEQILDELLFDSDGGKTRMRVNGIRIGGYFCSYLESLQWMAGWAQEAKTHGFRVLKYEDMFFDSAAALQALHRALYSADLPKSEYDGILALQKRTHKGGDLQASGAHPHYHYPRGYTGKMNVWRSYLTREQALKCNDITRAFLDVIPDADALTALYPNLLLNPDELSQEHAA